MSRRHLRRAAARRRAAERPTTTTTLPAPAAVAAGSARAQPAPPATALPTTDPPAPIEAATPPRPRRPAGGRRARYYCRQCGRHARAELPPPGWLRLQTAADPEVTARRGAGWGATDEGGGGLFDGWPCLIRWATDQAAAGVEAVTVAAVDQAETGAGR